MTKGPGFTIDPTLLEAEIDALLDLPAGERAPYIDAVRAVSPAKAAALWRWLRAVEMSEGFLGREALQPAHEGVGSRIGRWTIVGLIGEGGSSKVYQVERNDGAYQQRAALKLIKAERGPADWQMTQERQSLAGMIHSSIPRLLDGGTTADGRPYLVAQLIDGPDLDAWIASRKPSLGERIGVFRDVADALVYAHSRLIVHGDVKPANVMIGSDGHAYLIDFGIARILGLSESRDQPRLLTLAFAAPEMLEGETAGISSDVFALGLLLYRLLTGELPHRRESLGLAELRRCLDLDVPVPSTCRNALGVSPRKIRGDLDAIVLKATHRDRSVRYRNVTMLLDDIDAWRDLRPVSARAASTWYRLGRFLQRYAAVTSLAFVLIVVLAAGWFNAERQRQIVVRAQQDAVTVAGFRSELLSITDVRRGVHPATSTRDLYREAVRRLESPKYAGTSLDFAVLPIARALLSMEDLQWARRALEIANRSKVANARRDTMNAEYALSQRDAPRAMQLLDLADQADPTDAQSIEIAVLRARALTEMGRIVEADRLLKTQLARGRALFGADDVSTLAIEVARLDVLRFIEAPETAMAEARDVLARTIRALPGDHMLRVDAQLGLADILKVSYKRRSESDWYEAVSTDAGQLYEEAQATTARLIGRSNSATIRALEGRSWHAGVTGDQPGRMRLGDEANAIRALVYGQGSPNALLGSFDLAIRLMRNDSARIDEGIELAHRTLEAMRAFPHLRQLQCESQTAMATRLTYLDRPQLATRHARLAVATCGLLEGGALEWRARARVALADAHAGAAEWAASLDAASVASNEWESIGQVNSTLAGALMFAKLRAEVELGRASDVRATLIQMRHLQQAGRIDLVGRDWAADLMARAEAL